MTDIATIKPGDYVLQLGETRGGKRGDVRKVVAIVNDGRFIHLRGESASAESFARILTADDEVPTGSTVISVCPGRMAHTEHIVTDDLNTKQGRWQGFAILSLPDPDPDPWEYSKPCATTYQTIIGAQTSMNRMDRE